MACFCPILITFVPTIKSLRRNDEEVFCYDDGSRAAERAG